MPQLTVLPDVRPQSATTARLARAARRLVLRLDAAGAEQRAAQAREDRGVQLAPGNDGNANLIADLPGEQAVACWAALDHHARGRRADGDERTIRQLMADTLVERITGLAFATGPVPPPARVSVLVKGSTLCGADDDPGEIVGLGPVPASSPAASPPPPPRRCAG